MGQNILPFYLVCDESGSMSGGPIDAINVALPELHHEIGTNPVVSDKTQFGIIGFSDDADVLLELSDLSQVRGLPVLTAKRGTSYAAALKCVKDQIEVDVERLKAQGDAVFRPVVFFLTDGHPSADWRTEYDELVSDQFKYHPNIVAFGIGNQVDASVISSIATFRAFVDDGTMSPAKALQEFAVALTKSIVMSGSKSQADEGMTLQTPEEVPGFKSLALDPL
jgi:uncharacterized protein YegL